MIEIVTAKEFEEIKSVISQSKLLGSCLEEGASFNLDSTIKRGTRLLIVGTISPASSRGYFYTSPRSKMYAILDHLLPSCGFSAHRNHPDSLKRELEQRNVAFLDAFSNVIRKSGSSRDAEIVCGTLDYSQFSNALGLLAEDAIIVAVSKLSRTLLLEILYKLQPAFSSDEVAYCSIFTGESIETIADSWKNTFAERGFVL